MPYEEYFIAATESLIVADRSGRILEVNPKTESVFGYARDELPGQPVEILLPDRLRPDHRRHLENYFQAPRTRAMGSGLNLVGRRKDGTEFPVEVSLTYAPATRRGDVVVASVIDITQRLELEREARRAEGIASLGTIAAGIAHDLNNPLQIILSRAELLLQAPANMSGEVVEDLRVVHRHAERAGRIVGEFLRVSRQRENRLLPLQLSRVIDGALLLMGTQLRDSGIKVDLNVDRDIPQVVGDSTALERVLINLFSNARDAMPGGGVLTVASGLLDDRPGWLYLSVKDTGEGIEPAGLSKVFDLLYTTKTNGTGLGLWLSRRIVQEHGGRFEVHSQLGKGATFTISLPSKDAPR